MLVEPWLNRKTFAMIDFQYDNDTYKQIVVAGYLMAGFFAGFIFMIFIFSSWA